MAQSFGLTWWGQRWLDSLTHIDFANRIPRGARYARNGSVREVVFDKFLQGTGYYGRKVHRDSYHTVGNEKQRLA